MRIRQGFALALAALLGAMPGAGEPIPADTAADPPPAERSGASVPRLSAQERILERRALIQKVLARNRQLAAARRALEAARATARAADELPDAMASYAFALLSPFDRDVRFGQRIQLSQTIPWPGTLAQREERAEALADSAAAELERVRRELALTAWRLFDRLWELQRSLEINAEQRRLMRQFQAAATARYAAGLAPQQAPLAAEVEVAHLEHREIVLQTQRRTATARVNALLHRPPNSELPAPVAEVGLASAAPVAPLNTLLELARSRRPELAATHAEIEARIAEVELARLSGRPELTPMASYSSMWDQEAHRWMVGVGVSLPVWHRRTGAEAAAAEAQLAAARERQAALEVQIAAAVAAARARVRESRHVLRLYESRLLPAARDQVRAAESGYASGQVDFLAVIEAQRRLLDIRLGLAAARAAAQDRQAELAHAVGLPLSGEEFQLLWRTP